jgi:hypothetical protein
MDSDDLLAWSSKVISSVHNDTLKPVCPIGEDALGVFECLVFRDRYHALQLSEMGDCSFSLQHSEIPGVARAQNWWTRQMRKPFKLYLRDFFSCLPTIEWPMSIQALGLSIFTRRSLFPMGKVRENAVDETLSSLSPIMKQCVQSDQTLPAKIKIAFLRDITEIMLKTRSSSKRKIGHSGSCERYPRKRDESMKLRVCFELWVL